MIFSNERGSVIDAKITEIEEKNKELERCKDWRYYYLTYYRTVTENGEVVKPILDLSILNTKSISKRTR